MSYSAIPFNGGWSVRYLDDELRVLSVSDGWNADQVETLVDLLNETLEDEATEAITELKRREIPRGSVPVFGAKGVQTTRPSESSADVRAAAVWKLLPEVEEWMGDEEYESSELLADLLKASACDYGGYEFAKALEDHHHWSVDARLVEILDGYCFVLSSAHHAAVEAWLPTSGLKPQFSEGQEVQFEGHQAFIAAIDRKLGKYTVRVPALGHVEAGVGTHGRIVDWEVLDAQLVGAKSA